MGDPNFNASDLETEIGLQSPNTFEEARSAMP